MVISPPEGYCPPTFTRPFINMSLQTPSPIGRLGIHVGHPLLGVMTQIWTTKGLTRILDNLMCLDFFVFLLKLLLLRTPIKLY